MDKISDHRFNEVAVKSQDTFVTTSSCTKQRRQTTQEFSMCIKWRDGNTNCVVLKELKEAYPTQLVDYSVSDKISMEPAFAWWVPHNLKNRN